MFFMLCLLSSCADGASYNHTQNRQFSHLEKNYKKSSIQKKSDFIKSNQTNFNNNNKNLNNSYADYNPNPDFTDEGQDLNNNPIEKSEIKSGFEEVGLASWYGKDFDGKKTSSGEIFDSNKLTAAHPTLPLPSTVIITNLDNGKSIVVRVNDRGPVDKKRIIDVSKKAAILLGFRDKGIAKVKIELIK